MIDLRALTAPIALSMQLRDLGTLFLHVQCGCKSTSQPIGLMLSRGVSGTLAEVLGKMRCQRCRRSPSGVILADSVHAPPGPGETRLSSAPVDMWWIRVEG